MKRYGKYGRKTSQIFEMIWTLWKKPKLNSEKKWKIRKKSKLNIEMIWKIWKKRQKIYEIYGRK